MNVRLIFEWLQLFESTNTIALRMLVTFMLEQSTMAERGSSGIAVIFP